VQTPGFAWSETLPQSASFESSDDLVESYTLAMSHQHSESALLRFSEKFTPSNNWPSPTVVRTLHPRTTDSPPCSPSILSPTESRIPTETETEIKITSSDAFTASSRFTESFTLARTSFLRPPAVPNDSGSSLLASFFSGEFGMVTGIGAGAVVVVAAIIIVVVIIRRRQAAQEDAGSAAEADLIYEEPPDLTCEASWPSSMDHELYNPETVAGVKPSAFDTTDE
jgi:hypothetical protein